MAKRSLPPKTQEVPVPQPQVEKPKEEPLKQRKVKVVNCEVLRVRETASVNSKILFTVPVGTILLVNSELERWLSVCLPDSNKCGYVVKLYCKEI